MITSMTKIRLTGVVGAGLLAAAVLGFAAPAQADLGHNVWANMQNPVSTSAPHVVTIVPTDGVRTAPPSAAFVG